MKIFLIGYMGCGKTSLGRKLAHATGLRFVDMDAAIEEREGASVADIFRYEGEEYFRSRERRLIDELAESEEDMIISTGGGAPVWRDNMERMNEAGVTVYLRRTPEQIASIHDTCRILFQSELNYLTGCDKVEAEIPPSPERDALVKFVRSSQRGVVKPYSPRTK